MDKLFIIAYSIFIISITLLGIFFVTFLPETFSYKELREDYEHRLTDFRYEGYIKKIDQREGMYFITIESSCEINGILFSNKQIDINEEKGKQISAIGHKSLYKGKESIIFSEVRISE